MSLKDEINKLIPDSLKKQIKEVSQKFNQAPILTPPPANEPPVQLQEATLTDGTVIKYNTPTLAVGSEVTIVSAEGEMPAPEGELTLQDGTIIKVVNQGGKAVVESVTPGAGAPPAAPVQQEAATDVNAKILEIASLLKGFQEDTKSKFSVQENLNKELAETKKELAELKANFSAFAKVVDEVFSLPSAAPIETPKNKTSLTKIERFIHRNNP